MVVSREKMSANICRTPIMALRRPNSKAETKKLIASVTSLACENGLIQMFKKYHQQLNKGISRNRVILMSYNQAKTARQQDVMVLGMKP
jgi:hypothetical protein